MFDTGSGYAPPSGEHPFAVYLRILGKGKKGARSLTIQEAQQAFTMVLRGEAEPLQIGAFLMLLRVKEETPEELAGFVLACRDNMVHPPVELSCHLDWSTYAGKKHQHPWYILALLLLADAGYRVFIHGTAGHTPGRLYTENAMRDLGLPVAASWGGVEVQLNDNSLSYLSLGHFCPALEALMLLRPLLGLRSPVNTLSRLLNPLNAAASLQSVFHPAYARLHQEAGAILKQMRAIVFKGESGEVEVKPQADTRASLLTGGLIEELCLPRSIQYRMDAVASPQTGPLRELWRGTTIDVYGCAAILATVAMALMALTPGMDMASAQCRAAELWDSRDRSRLS